MHIALGLLEWIGDSAFTFGQLTKPLLPASEHLLAPFYLKDKEAVVRMEDDEIRLSLSERCIDRVAVGTEPRQGMNDTISVGKLVAQCNINIPLGAVHDLIGRQI